MQPGDVLCVLPGGKIPFALRRRTDRWAPVGKAYLNDLHILLGKTVRDAAAADVIKQIEKVSIV
jgi:hypothetical protein